MRNISQTVRNRKLVSAEGHYKVPYRLPKKVKYLTFGDHERTRSLNKILEGNISQTVGDREFVSTEGHYKVPYRLPKKVKYLSFGDHKRTRSLNEILEGNISQTVRDREFVSTECHYKVPYRLPENREIFDFRWPWEVKVTNGNLRCEISRQRCEIENSYQQKAIIKSHIGFPKKLKYLTFGDPEMSRSLTEIFDTK